jgi:SNF2 family DNA or RNA helicase
MFLPPVIHEERFVEMSAKQKKAYKDMKKHMMAEVEGGFALATSSLVQMGRLVQFAVAYAEVAYDEKTGEEYIKMSEPSSTLDAMMDDITSGDFGEDSVAISAGGPGSRQILELLSARLTKAGLRHGMITGGLSADVRQKSIDEFQSGEIKYILYTVQAGGVGVTLTRARRLLRIMRPFSFIDDPQSNDRVHRIGSEIHDNIIITDYVVADSVQQRVQEILGDKAEQAEEIVRDKEKLLKFAKEAINE